MRALRKARDGLRAQCLYKRIDLGRLERCQLERRRKYIAVGVLNNLVQCPSDRIWIEVRHAETLAESFDLAHRGGSYRAAPSTTRRQGPSAPCNTVPVLHGSSGLALSTHSAMAWESFARLSVLLLIRVNS